MSATETELRDISEPERRSAAFCHWGVWAQCLIPLGNIMVPMSIWKAERKVSPFVDEQGKESLNYQFTMLLVLLLLFFISLVLIVVVPILMIIDTGSGIEAASGVNTRFVVVGILAGVFVILQLGIPTYAGFRVYHGHHFRYPFSIRKFVK